MAQPIVPPRPVNIGEGSSGQKRKRKKGNKESYEAAKARTRNNHCIRHAWFKWFAENVEHKDTFRRYNTPGTNMGIRRFVEHLCELGRQTESALLTKVEMWQRWFEAGKARPVRLGSFSYKMKGCEPISDNQLRWITLRIQILSLTCTTGNGSYGSVYRIGFRDVALGKELGMEGVVSYVAKKCDAIGTNSAWVMMHKELASFAETHCAIVRPIACHNIEAQPLLVYPYWNGNLITDHPDWFPDPPDFETLRNWKNVEIFRAHRLEIMCTLWSALDFMHEHNWFHYDIHVKNMFLHFLDWDFDEGFQADRMPTWEDKRSLVFAALGDLGMAQQVHVAASDNGVKYTRTDPVERDWIALELVDEKIRELARKDTIIRPVNEYNKTTDVYALGVFTQKVCGDFFTDMTKPEWKAYNDKYYDEGADTDTSHATRSQGLLKGLIDTATHDHCGLRNSAARFFAIMSNMMKINPMTCSRPIETPSQQKRETTTVYKDYLNSGRVNMAYDMAFHEMRQRGLLP
ncbi:hypothetical protein R1sor_002899 [Riccia sorocarpa]|uniref:Protein kinase domain-containing protein n=1 Tax=Riccia sorocarpa TaxID=122646 RepID=A0ABD3H366_9MARC